MAQGKIWGPQEGGHQGLGLSPSVHSAPPTQDRGVLGRNGSQTGGSSPGKSKAGTSTLALLTFGAILFVVGTVLCLVGCFVGGQTHSLY